MDTQTSSLKLQIKSDNNNDGIVSGYAATYNNTDSVNDVFYGGAFSEIKRSIKMLLEHRTDQLIGVWNDIKEDQQGLFVEGKISTKTSYGGNAYELAKDGVLTDLSVGYIAKDYSWDDKGIRHIKKADLFEVSLVAFPANEMARIISVKSSDIQNERDFENALRLLGYSNREAKHIAIYGYKSLQHKKETGQLLDPEKNINFDAILKELKNFKL